MECPVEFLCLGSFFSKIPHAGSSSLPSCLPRVRVSPHGPLEGRLDSVLGRSGSLKMFFKLIPSFPTWPL